MGSDVQVDSIEAWHIGFPVTPFPLGSRMITSRDYTVVRIRDREGATGVAFGLARNAPVARIVREMVAPALAGKTIDFYSLGEQLRSCLGLHYMEGLLSRAVSLVDIAAVDLLARASGAPVWKLLAPDAEPQPLLFSNVVGFEKAQETDADFVARVVHVIEDGYRSVKLAASAVDPERFARRLRDIRSAASATEIIVDLDGSWSNVERTVEMARAWQGERIAWIEDAVRADRPDLVDRLHQLLPAPLAIGDEATSLPLLLRLVDQRLVDILRADLTCIGGLSVARSLRDATAANDLRLSYHAYPWIHQHAAFAYGQRQVESFELDSPFEVSHRFLSPLPTVRIDDAVHVPVPTAPGMGVEVDWDVVLHHQLDSDRR